MAVYMSDFSRRVVVFASPYTQALATPSKCAKWIFVSLIGYGTFKLVAYCYRKIKIKRHLSRIPSPPKHWLYGNIHLHPGFGDGFLEWVEELTRQHPRIMSFYIGPFRGIVALNHPETLKEVMKTAEPKAMSGGGYSLLVPWLGEGLLTSSGALWRRNRRLLTPAFHFDVLKPYVDVYNDAVSVLMTKWDSLLSKSSDDSIEVCEPVSLCTLDIILRCAFSYPQKIQLSGAEHPYVKAINSISLLIMKRGINPILFNKWIYLLTANGREFKRQVDFLHSVSYDIIRERRQQLQVRGPISLENSSGDKRKLYLDFLDILLSARDEFGEGLTDQEIRQEVDTFLFEGHDTTASGISWSLHDLALHQDVQEQVFQEVNTNLDGSYTRWEDLPKLALLTRCIKESIRLHSPVPFISRQLTQPRVIDGYHIPVGTIVDINIYAVHHNSQVWGDEHNLYRPDRFLPDNFNKMDPYAYIAFSAGPRNCIGQNFAMNEEKVIISRIVQKYRMELDDHHEVKKRVRLVMRTENGIKIKFTPRH